MKTLTSTKMMEECSEKTQEILRTNYDFTPDNFQLHACNQIENDENILVTAHTGSGKTLIAEYTILSKIAKGKKVIYTSPIKSLSNQKYYEFCKKFPNISFGIITGDIKYSPQAQVLIMTTEILRNLLYKKPVMLDANTELEVNMKEVGAVIYDEVHYINDKDRGKVWEESMIMMPGDINMVMLSATIREPEKMCNWLNNIKETEICLIPNERRIIPLKHFVYNKVYPQVQKQKNVYGEIGMYDDKLIEIMDENNIINVERLDHISKMVHKYQRAFEYKGLMNYLLKYLKKNDMLPGLAFVFSRNKCEKMAKYTTENLLTKEEIVTQRKKIRYYLSKLDHHEQLEQTHQYRMLSRCMEKGVAFHHGGMIPALKELVELLYDDGLIKFLYATETFAVGINMPTRTVIFTSITKYETGIGFRMLHSHEYTQMAGRAGRRGKDTQGYVIHLPSIYRDLDNIQMRHMLEPKSQMIESKFDYHYSLILQAYSDRENNKIDLNTISSNSLACQEIRDILYYIRSQSDGQDYSKYNICLEAEELSKKIVRVNGMLEYKSKKQQAKDLKKRKLMAHEEGFIELWDEYLDKKEYIHKQLNLSQEYYKYSMMMQNNCCTKIDFLKHMNYMNEELQVTDRGRIAMCFNEINPIIGETIVNINMYDGMTKEELVNLMSSFGDITSNVIRFFLHQTLFLELTVLASQSTTQVLKTKPRS